MIGNNYFIAVRQLQVSLKSRSKQCELFFCTM